MGNSSLCACVSNEIKDKKDSNINLIALSKDKFDKINKSYTQKVITNIDKKLNDEMDSSKKINEESEQSSLKNNINNNIIKDKRKSKKNSKNSSDSTNISENEKKHIREEEEKKTNEESEKKLKEEDEKNILKGGIEINIKQNKTKENKPKSNKTILICGPLESGKTSFLIRFCNDKYDDFYIPSFSNEIKEKKFLLNHRQKEFYLRFIVTNNLNDDLNEDIDCIFVIYDVSVIKSYENAKQIVIDKILTRYKNIIIFFIGNKKDLKENINAKDVEKFCLKYNLINIYISVKDNIGIVALMQKFSELFNYE